MHVDVVHRLLRPTPACRLVALVREEYNGSMTITGPLNASFSYSDLSIDSSVDVSKRVRAR